jgi:hypothetical protein
MTLGSFVVKNAFRNKRRSALTVLSIGFSLLLLTLMMTIWRTFYIDQGAPDSAKRLMTRHRVSLTFFLPGYYREKIRALPGVVYVAPMTWFGGRYKDDKPENFFAQFAILRNISKSRLTRVCRQIRRKPGFATERVPWWMWSWPKDMGGRLAIGSF